MDFLDPLHFDVPALKEAVGDGVSGKLPHSLAFVRGGWVEGSGDPLVMALVVGDDEVGVEEADVEEVAEEAVEAALAVAQLMADDNLLSFSEPEHPEG